MLQQMTTQFPNVEVIALDPARLLIQFASQVKASVLLRGIRNSTDHDYEQMMAHFNEWMEPAIRTVYIGPEPGQPFVSSSFVKQLVGMEDWNAYVHALVSKCVMPYLRKLEEQLCGGKK
jgi:pantetheine-phosphate adenylyltransferase